MWGVGEPQEEAQQLQQLQASISRADITPWPEGKRTGSGNSKERSEEKFTGSGNL